LLVSTPLFAQENIEARELNLENYKYPYPVEYFEVHAQQEKLSMAYMFIKAESSNGKTITLLHGKNFNAAYWETTIDTLIAEGYDVLVPDQIGFGKSTKPKHFQYSFQQLALNTKTLLDSLNISENRNNGALHGRDACHKICTYVSGYNNTN
jgi:pimeloyl-ACP methyl ester carboxylesterase